MAEKTLFQKIIDGDIPSEKIHEDEHCIGIRDINPGAPIHLLVIPKPLITRVAESSPEDKSLLGHLIHTAGQLGQQHGPDGFRIVINNGPQGGETIPHLHVHVLAGRPLSWPPG